MCVIPADSFSAGCSNVMVASACREEYHSTDNAFSMISPVGLDISHIPDQLSFTI